MRYQELLLESRAHYKQMKPIDNQLVSSFVFTNGAEWMLERMNELDGKERIFDTSISYEKYGYSKYGICLVVFLLTGIFLFFKAIFLLPLAIIVFYFLEIHSLFLFPLLIDKVENPIRTSIRMTYEIGIFSVLATVIPIGFFMLIGLLNLRNPLKNWYLGCLSILIWYGYEKD